ncbi:hypothetical protein K456DRAFT_1028305 [Colletotrichum gloeosporioides 23]|nr:hypothetical protein K456DRAFT_1028305 [Colletotrichum gloeosporioides 23]
MGEISFFSPERSLFSPTPRKCPARCDRLLRPSRSFCLFLLRKAKPNPRDVQCGGMSAGCKGCTCHASSWCLPQSSGLGRSNLTIWCSSVLLFTVAILPRGDQRVKFMHFLPISTVLFPRRGAFRVSLNIVGFAQEARKQWWDDMTFDMYTVSGASRNTHTGRDLGVL